MSAGTWCYWSRSTKTITCDACFTLSQQAVWAPPPAPGTAGESARRKAHTLGARGSSWAKGADGEELLAPVIDVACAGIGYVFHDKPLPGSKRNFDHIAVVPSGVFVIDAKNISGAPRRVNYGGSLVTDERLLIGNTDQTMWIEGLASLTNAVSKVAASNATAVMCFVNQDVDICGGVVRGAAIVDASQLAEMLRRSGPLSPVEINAIALRLESGLRPR
jgi:Nuclease-related domain